MEKSKKGPLGGEVVREDRKTTEVGEGGRGGNMSRGWIGTVAQMYATREVRRETED